MPRTLPASSGARKWPGHQRPKPPSSTAQALSRSAVGRMRVRDTAKISEASHRSAALMARPTTQGSSRWLSRKFMKRCARSCARWRVIPPREHRLVHFGTARGTLSTFGRDFGSGAAADYRLAGRAPAAVTVRR